MRFCRIDHASAEYVQEKALRDAVMRVPLGMRLSDEDVAGEEDQWHFVAMDGDAVVACVLFKKLGDREIKLRQMAVAEHLQGQGVGQQLVRYAEDIVRQAGFRRIVTDARIRAQGFYARLGYAVEGEPYSVLGIPSIQMAKGFAD